MAQTTEGGFEVSLTPQPSQDGVGDESVARLGIVKQFTGGITGESRGEILATRTGVDGSAGYVAMERVTGLVDGLAGSFSLQHSGTADRGNQSLAVSVVPDSGTGELVGLRGTMAITIEGGEHRYEFNYELTPYRPAPAE